MTTTTTTAPIVGEIAGQPVYLELFEGGNLCGLSMTWQGMTVLTDGAELVEMPMSGDFMGACSLAEWAAIKALAQTDVMEQLIAMAQRYRQAA